MATSFAQPAQTIHSPPYYPAFRQHSTPPSNNVSPTNNASYLQARQINQRRQPVYIPAVLRPTEIPGSRHGSLTPPASAKSSMDSGKGLKSFPQQTGPSPPLSPAETDGRNFGPWGPASISRVVTDEWNDDALGSVTGAPTRNHWKPDSSATLCSSTDCPIAFNFFARRHHCRRCGNIFCGSHATHAVPLDQEARFHPEGSHQRACDSCYSDYRTWRRSRNSRQNSVTSGLSDETIPSTPIGVQIPGQDDDSQNQQVAGSVAQSFGYSHWSTF